MGLLRPHQYEAVAHLLPALQTYDGAYLAHSPGCGKTLTTITLAKLLGAKRIVVVVGPVNALGVWRLELQKWWPGATYHVYKGENTHVTGGWAQQPLGPHFEIVNVQRLVDRELSEKEKAEHRKPRTTGKMLLNTLCRQKPDLLIFDECHYLANYTAQTRAVWKLREASTKVLLLSGTPVHDIRGYRTQYRMIARTDPLWTATKKVYEDRVCKFKGPEGNWFDGPKEGATEAIAQRVAPYTHWFKTADLSLPEPIYSEVPVSLYPEEQRAYAAMEKDFRAELDAGRFTSASTALVKAMRLHQLACGHATDDTGRDAFAHRSAKLDALLELLHAGYRKIIVVCRFTAEVDHVVAEAVKFWPGGPGQQINVARIDGNVKGPERENIIAAFQGHRVPKLLVMQPKSGGIAATLTAADAMIFYSFEPSHIVWEQTVGRVWRMGQTTHVQIISLVDDDQSHVDRRLYDGLRAAMEDNDLAKHVIGVADAGGI